MRAKTRQDVRQASAGGAVRGDIVRYHGSVKEYQGTLWEVTRDGSRGLVLHGGPVELQDVRQSSVTVIQRGTRATVPVPPVPVFPVPAAVVTPLEPAEGQWWGFP